MNNNFDIRRFFIPESSSIKEAMKIVESAKRRIGFVVDNTDKILKAVSDGDIVRYLMKSNNTINDSVLRIHERKPIVLYVGHSENQKSSAFTNNVSCIPLLNDNGVIIDLIFNDIRPNFPNAKSRKIGIVGLGYVGLTLSLVMAEKGFNVIGFDLNDQLIKNLKKKIPPFFENNIDIYIENNIGNNLDVTSELKPFKADVYIVSVGTPIDKKTMLPNTDSLIRSINNISKLLKQGDLIIMRSTLPINFTNSFIIPKISNLTNLKYGIDFFVSVCPERTIEGNALNELMILPQIIGADDFKSSEISMSIFNEISQTVVDVGSLRAAEMSKLIDNSYRDHRFSFANNMALLSEKLELDFNDIVSKVNLGYERNDIPYPSPGVGGPCLSKDPYILSKAFKDNGLSNKLIMSVRETNESAPKNIVERYEKTFQNDDLDIKKEKIFIIGFAFKGNPETSDLRDSTTLWLLDHFKERGYNNIYGFDPVINENELRSQNIKTCSIEEGFTSARSVFIMNNHLSYAKLDITNLSSEMKRPGMIYDAWSIFSSVFNNNNNLKYLSVGR